MTCADCKKLARFIPIQRDGMMHFVCLKESENYITVERLVTNKTCKDWEPLDRLPFEEERK